jgi:hypothetical protein
MCPSPKESHTTKARPKCRHHNLADAGVKTELQIGTKIFLVVDEVFNIARSQAGQGKPRS